MIVGSVGDGGDRPMKARWLWLIAATAFAAGVGFDSLFIDSNKVPSGEKAFVAAPDNEREPSAGGGIPPRSALGEDGRSNEVDAKAKTGADRTLELQPHVVDALLARGGLTNRSLKRMELGEDDIEAVKKWRIGAMEDFRELEKKHSTTQTDERGEFVAIAAFPDDRARWLEDLESDIRNRIPGDLAAVLARMIAFEDNDEAIGMFRREVFIREKPNPSGKIIIEERTFNEQGQRTDSDFDLATPGGRWSHLLEIKAE